MTAPTTAESAFDEAVKLARRIRVLIDAGEHALAVQLYQESRGFAVAAIELDPMPAHCGCGHTHMETT
jgi:hypothetical protein